MTPEPELSHEQLTELVQVARALSAEVNLEALLESILTRATKLTSSPASSVILKHRNRPALYIAAATGTTADVVLASFGKHAAGSIPIEGSQAGRVFTTRESFFDNDLRSHFDDVDKESEESTRSMVCVPLEVAGEAIGVMQALNGLYTHQDVILMEHLAAFAAVAIRNAQLFEGILAHSGFYTRVSTTSELQDLVEEFEGDARQERLTVVFADMRGFTQLIQSLGSPPKVQASLNEFIAMLVDEVLLRDGLVNKMMGDGVMALFRGGNHEERAVRSAFGMLEAFGALKERWDAEASEDLGFLGMGVGIVTDDVMLGAIGSEDVRDYTAIGAAVNLAAAFEEHARGPNKVLANQLALNGVEHIVDFEQLDHFELKKPSQDVGIKHKCYSLKALHRKALEQLFISHNSRDAAVVNDLLVRPLEEAQLHTWVASEAVHGGARWAEEIHRALERSTWMLVVVSENSAGSRWVRLEVQAALEIEALDGRIVPICLDETPVTAVNKWLKTMQAIDARATPDVAAAIVQLVGQDT